MKEKRTKRYKGIGTISVQLRTQAESGSFNFIVTGGRRLDSGLSRLLITFRTKTGKPRAIELNVFSHEFDQAFTDISNLTRQLNAAL